MINLTLPNGDIKQVESGSCGLDVAQMIGAGLAKAALAIKYNGKLVDLRTPLLEDGTFSIITSKDPQGQEVIKHSAEHIMAQVVKEIWPNAQVDVGRTDHSEKFQYDFKVDQPFTEEDLEKIEKAMQKSIEQKHVFSRQVVTREEAKTIFKEKGELLKLERLADIPEGEDISIFSHGGFVDLCRGPHVQHAGQIGAVKILDASASYFKGDENNEVLQRIYGTAFSSKAELKDYLTLIEEAKRRDHRKLGKELDLFSVSDEVGPGLILWHPKGALLRHLVEEFWKQQHLQNGYDFAYTPHIAKSKLWETSGHTEFYQENMFSGMDVDDQGYLVKPMNCPFHVQIFKSKLKSYRDLPVRIAELGTVYRYERSGVLHGLLRVRGFTQDDAHLFVAPKQLNEEIFKVLQFVQKMFARFGFHEYEIYLSTRPEKSVGTDEDWALATEALQGALEKSGLSYNEDPGEGVFYGPKIDIKIKDSIGRSWQCATIQADFNLPMRFNLQFVDDDGQKKAPIMIHRALFGSIERFLGCLIEHYAGVFPFWLAPVQLKLLPITQDHHNYAKTLKTELASKGFRVELDDRSEKLGYKIREAQIEKVPFALVIGDQELKDKTVSLRARGQKDMKTYSLDALVAFLHENMEEK
ncbi:MAG TPA: threonine--tRNA ligase [Oligoflexia bacterium]|nr:threonine--tRNA ligase [Oligoflexia bacterium]HMR24111.1 threonine--tRNA ligase [Oligoflexia bacterium]